MPPSRPTADLLMVGHSLLEASNRDDWETVTALLARRQTLLESIDPRSLSGSEAADYRRALAVGSEVLSAWKSQRRALLEDAGRARDARRAYRTVSPQHDLTEGS